MGLPPSPSAASPRRPSALFVASLGLLALAAVLVSLPGATAPAMPSPSPCAILGGPPANDNYGSATGASSPWSGSGNTLCATLQSGENIPCCAEGKTVWFVWTPSFDGVGIVHTCNSSFDTVLAAYDGTSVSDPEIVYNDDAGASGPCPWTLQSYLEFECESGTTYHIQLGGYSGASGNYQIDVSGCDGSPPPPCPGPANNCFDSPIVVPSVPYTNSQSTNGATMQAGEPAPCGAMGSTVWYEWTSTADGMVTIDTVGSSYDTVLAAYTGSTITGLTQLACNDDFPSCCLSQIQFYCQAGVTYRIQVGGFGGSQGPLQLNIGDCLPAPPPPPPGCGYTIEDPIPFDWVELDPAAGGSGTGIPNGDYTAMAITPDPPFTFDLCGISYETFWASSKGSICMGPDPYPTGNMFNFPPNCPQWWNVAPLPDSSLPGGMVYGYWADLFPGACPGGNGMTCQFYEVQGTAPNRVLIVEWKDVPYWPCCYPDPHTFQIKLFEADDCIEVHYRDVQASNGMPSSAGFESADSTAGWTYAFSWSGFSRTSEAWRACPVPPFTAVEDAYVFNEDDAAHVLDVRANDIDATGGPIAITAFTTPSKGTAALVDGELVYTPALDENGADLLEYTVQNSEGDVSTGTISIWINPVNDPPSFTAQDLYVIVTPADGPQVLPGWGSDVLPAPLSAADEAGQAVNFAIASGTGLGIFASPPQALRSGGPTATEPTVPPVTGPSVLVSFAPSGNSGEARVCYVAVDGGGTQTVTNSWDETATGDDTSDTPHCLTIRENAAPVAYFEANSAHASPRAGVVFDSCPGPAPRCTHDPDGILATYLWEFGDGLSSGATHPLHAYALPGEYMVRLSVWDEHGVAATYSRSVVVSWPASSEPDTEPAASGLLADAGSDVTVLEGSRVQLVGLARGGDETTAYRWEQVFGEPVQLEGRHTQSPSFTAPRLSGVAPIDLQFGLVASFDGAESEMDYVVVHVVSANQVPVASAGGTRTVPPGSVVELDGRASSDADGDALTFRWEQVPEPGETGVSLLRADTATPFFEAPMTPGTFHFRLTVSDGKSTAEDRAIIVVQPQPQAARNDEADARAPGLARAMAEDARSPNLLPFLVGAALFLAAAAGVAALFVRRHR